MSLFGTMKVNNAYVILTFLFGKVLGDCPFGFLRFQDNCYAVLPYKVSWAEALSLCKAFKAKLAWIENDLEQTFVTGMLGRDHDSISTSEIWLSGTDMYNKEGSWVWAGTLKPFTYTHFLPGQPDNDGTGSQHCLALFRDRGFQWDDYFCDHKLVPLCKASANTDFGQIIG